MGRTKREQRRRKSRLGSNHNDYVFCSEEDDDLDDMWEEDDKNTAARHSLISAHLRDTASRSKRRKSIPIQETTTVRVEAARHERAHVRDKRNNAALETTREVSPEDDDVFVERTVQVPEKQQSHDEVEDESQVHA